MWMPRSFPFGLDGLLAEQEKQLLCPVCNEYARVIETRSKDKKRVYRHEGIDYCVAE